MVVNLCQFNFHKVKKNSKLESQIKIILNKKLELLMEEDLCQLNLCKHNHLFKRSITDLNFLLQVDGDQLFQKIQNGINH